MSSSEPQDLDPSLLEEASPPPAQPVNPNRTEHLDQQLQPDVPVSPASDLAPSPDPAAVEVCCSPSDRPAPIESAVPAKKKKSFFSKGKKLFKKLGSSKKE